MSETRPTPGITIPPEDYDLVLDALRFARDEFFDDNCLPWSNDEHSRLQDIIDTIEPLDRARSGRPLTIPHWIALPILASSFA